MSELHGPPLRIALRNLEDEKAVKVTHIEGFGPLRLHVRTAADVEQAADFFELRGPVLGNVITASGRVAGAEVMFVAPRLAVA